METESNTIGVYIHGLRRKLGENSVITFRHLGYQVKSNCQGSRKNESRKISFAS
jgi:hypothetical protein